MKELANASGDEEKTNGVKSSNDSRRARRGSEDILGLGNESEKERAIAKAALTVAELGQYSLIRPNETIFNAQIHLPTMDSCTY